MAEDAKIHKISGCSSDFLIRMNALRKEGILCDVTLEVEEKSFVAHRNVLALSSGYFQGMFTTDMRESHMNTVEICGIEATIFESILDFIYTGSIEINEDNVVQLWIAFDYFAIFNVEAQDTCNIFLIEVLKEQIKRKQNVDSFLDLWEIRNRAHLMGKKRLISVVEKLIGSDLKELIMTKEFLELKVVDLCDLIGSDNLFTESEETIFETGINWIKFREEERIKFLPEIFAKIRLNLLSRNFLIEIVNNERLIADSEPCRNLILRHLDEGNERSEETSRSRNSDPTGNIYLIGGTYREGRMAKYGPDEDIWMEAETMPSKRIEMGVAVLKGKIYIVGGCDGDISNNVHVVEVFNPETNEWSEICDIPESRCFPAVTASKDFIYVCGGYNQTGALNSVECFNPNINSWLPLPPMKKHRQNASAVMLNGYIYVMGGYNSNDEVLNSVERFDPQKDTWEEVSPMIIKRAEFGAAILEGKIYVCGGENENEALVEVEVYDPNKDIWEPIEPMSSKRTRVAIVSNMGKIWAFGGLPVIEDDLDDDYQAHETVEVYDPDTKMWTEERRIEMMDSAVACVV